MTQYVRRYSFIIIIILKKFMGVSVTWIGERVTVEDIFGIVKHGKGVHVEVGEKKVIKCRETFHVR